MAVNSVLPPYFNFRDSTGAALENGFIYVGQPGLEARSSPKASFFDIGLTIPTGTASGAAIRTRGGFPVNQSRAPAMFYVDGDFSISVTDKNGVLLYSSLNNTLALNFGDVGAVLWADGDLGAAGGGFAAESNTGFVRPSAGVMQTAIAGTLGTELTTAGLRTAVPLLRAIAPSVTAGTNAQGQAPLTQDFNVVTTAANNPSGVTLPTAVAGRRVTVVNRGANLVNVYPATGAQIGALALNTPWPVLVGTSLDFIARSATQWEPTVDGLGLLADPGGFRSVGWDDTANAFAFFPTPGQPQQTVAGAGQTEMNFTGIPTWVNRVTVTGRNVGTNGTSVPCLRIGDGAIVSTGYAGSVSSLTTVVGSGLETTGCDLANAWTATTVQNFDCTITRQSGNSWVFAGTGSFTSSAGTTVFGSAITLSGALDRVRLTTLGGTDTFDVGSSVSIAWE